MNTNYFAFLINPLTEISLGVKIENQTTTILTADAKSNIVFFTDNNKLYLKPIIGTANPIDYIMDNTIISISLDEVFRIIVIGTTSSIQVFPYDNSQLPL